MYVRHFFSPLLALLQTTIDRLSKHREEENEQH